MQRHTPPVGAATLGRRLRLKRAFGGAELTHGPSSYTLDTDLDNAGTGSETDSSGYFHSPITPSSNVPVPLPLPLPQQGWRPHNYISHSANSSINVSGQSASHKLMPGPNPWLSAIPRSAGLGEVGMNGMGLGIPAAGDGRIMSLGLGIGGMREIQRRSAINAMGRGVWRGEKRRVQELESTTDVADEEYDGEESAGDITDADRAGSDEGGDREEVLGARSVTENGGNGSTTAGEEKKAAWLLMKLSVKDGEASGNEGGGRLMSPNGEDGDLDGPRVKRRRATSM